MAFYSVHGAQAAQAAAKKKREEEEEMTQYSSEELETDWEFKFVRSATGAFKKPEVVAQLREEEALSDWRMVEKFDNNRIRFKRPASAQRKDHMLPLGIDPYRSQYGISESAMGFRIAMAILLVVAAVIIVGKLIEYLINNS